MATRTLTTQVTTTGAPKTDKVHQRVLTYDSIAPAVKDAEYAVRGAIPIRAEQIEQEIEKHSFGSVIHCNIGNPQLLGQKPLTFLRQVCALVDYPELMSNPELSKHFPSDAVARARQILGDITSSGAYSHSMGALSIRRNVAKFIEKRDGYPSSPDNIFLTAGASAGVANLMNIILHKPNDGVLIPIPQYPLYTATIALNRAVPVPYYLNESQQWGLNVAGVEKSLADARSNGTHTKIMVVINPGNPTGNTLSLENMQDIIRLCYNESLVLFADEVYQDNIYDEKRPFYSFKHVLHSMGEPYSSSVELVSLHSISKGKLGECGRRGGYFELENFLPEVVEQIYKMVSIHLCPPILGQIGVDAMVHPPQPGDPSYELWESERAQIQSDLSSRSATLASAFNSLEGVSCNAAQGAMYLFPKVDLPPKAIDAAKANNQSPDAFYALALLEQTGICVVPGSGFGQEEGTFHIRTTFLAPGVDEYVARFTKFHNEFLKTYA